LTEYLLTFVAIMLMAGGMFYVGFAASGVLSAAQAGLGGNVAEQTSSRPSTASSTETAALRRDVAAVAVRRLATIRPLLAIAATGLGVGLLLMRSARRRRTPDERVDESDDAPTDAPSKRRLYEKRQTLRRMLRNEQGTLSTNGLLVRHLMTREVRHVAPSATAEEVQETMDEHGLRHILVCNGKGKLLGVISNRDLAGNPKQRARSLMTTRVHTVSAESGISQAVSHMIDKGISCLPAVDENESLCGVITTTDVVLSLQCAMELLVRPEASLSDSRPAATITAAAEAPPVDGELAAGLPV
jgi:predicted transcriptional regulator